MPPRCEFRMKVRSKPIYCYVQRGKQNIDYIAFMKKPNEPLHSKPFPIYIGLQEQLYEPWVLVQDEFGWNPFILTV